MMNAHPRLQVHHLNNGYTLVELLIVMVLFITVILISTSAFNKVLSTSVQQVKSSESNIQGVVGLEIMRSDLERAGYGLPWCQSFIADWAESNVTANFLANGIDPASFNDTNNPKRAIKVGIICKALELSKVRQPLELTLGRTAVII
jgi:Tfp pilus assembly protein PilW